MKLHNISFNNLNRRKGKMIFLVLGLFIGIATIVTLLSITESMSRDIGDRLDQFGANIIMVPRSENLSLSYGGVSMGGVNYKTVEFDEARIPEAHSTDDEGSISEDPSEDQSQDDQAKTPVEQLNYDGRVGYSASAVLKALQALRDAQRLMRANHAPWRALALQPNIIVAKKASRTPKLSPT